MDTAHQRRALVLFLCSFRKGNNDCANRDPPDDVGVHMAFRCHTQSPVYEGPVLFSFLINAKCDIE